MSALEVFDSFEKAAETAREEHSGSNLVKTRRHIALSPKYIGRLRTGVHEILDAELGRFIKSWNGVLLAYGNMKLLQSSGAIVDDSPFIHFDVELEAVIFKPSIGSILKCVVNELASDHIGCLVHDWFNVSLLPSKEQINGQWQPRLEPGYVVLVQVEKLRMMNGMLAIEAREPCDGFGLNQHSDLELDTTDGLAPKTAAGMESNKKPKKKKKRKKSDSDEASVQESSYPDEPNTASTLQAGEETNRKKKSKKPKMSETTMESSESLASNNPGDETTGKETSHKKKKKKKHGEIETIVKSSVAAVTEDIKYKVPETTGTETSHKKKKKKKKSDKDEMTSAPNCSNRNVEVKTKDLETPKKKRKKNSSAPDNLSAKDEGQPRAFTKLKKKKSNLTESYHSLFTPDSQCELSTLMDEAGPDMKAKKKKKKSKQKHDRNDNEVMNNLDLKASVKKEPNQLDSQRPLTSGSKMASSEMSHKNHKRKKK